MFLVEKEKGEVILNEDYNNKQKERVRRDFKDKIHHHGMKKEDARESLRSGQIFTRVIFKLGYSAIRKLYSSAYA